MGHVVQLLVSVQPDGMVAVSEVDATVPSGMGVRISDMRTCDLMVPVQIKLGRPHVVENPGDVIPLIEAAVKKAAEPGATGKPWRPGREIRETIPWFPSPRR